MASYADAHQDVPSEAIPTAYPHIRSPWTCKMSVLTLDVLIKVLGFGKSGVV